MESQGGIKLLSWILTWNWIRLLPPWEACSTGEVLCYVSEGNTPIQWHRLNWSKVTLWSPSVESIVLPITILSVAFRLVLCATLFKGTCFEACFLRKKKKKKRNRTSTPELYPKLMISLIQERLRRDDVKYACAVWSGGPTGCLQRLQDSFAKRHSLSLPPLEKRFEYHTLVLFYRVRANLASTYLSSLVPPLTSTKSGYSFRKESYPVPLTKKSSSFCPVQLFPGTPSQQRCSLQRRC